jgi:NAD(P)-dependent dehydrogenase (short-subunit alcohol dehydrogenase family)
MRLVQALLPNLRKGKEKTIIVITSGLASIHQNQHGRKYGNRESKVGLNMFIKSVSAELRSESFFAVVLKPGWVRTDIFGPNAFLSPKESFHSMISVIEGLTPDDSGKFIQFDGKLLP